MATEIYAGEVWQGYYDRHYRARSRTHRYIKSIDPVNYLVTYTGLDGDKRNKTNTIKLQSFKNWAKNRIEPESDQWLNSWNAIIGGVPVVSSKNKVKVTGAVGFPDLLGWNDLEPGDVVRGQNGTFLIVMGPDGLLAVNLQTFTAEPEGGMFLRVEATIALR